jgi:tRNA threonylcarbamoyladenosine biosynthesis protein TsaE
VTRVRRTLALREILATTALGRCLARIVAPGDILLLSGDLGTGKTTLTKALAVELGIDEREVTSPSFSIIHEHQQGRPPLVHVDLYRLGPDADTGETGLEDYLDGTNLLIIEWAEYLKDPAALEGLAIRLRWVDESAREAELEGAAAIWEGRLRVLDTCMKETMNNGQPDI